MGIDRYEREQNVSTFRVKGPTRAKVQAVQDRLLRSWQAGTGTVAPVETRQGTFISANDAIGWLCDQDADHVIRSRK